METDNDCDVAADCLDAAKLKAHTEAMAKGTATTPHGAGEVNIGETGTDTKYASHAATYSPRAAANSRLMVRARSMSVRSENKKTPYPMRVNHAHGLAPMCQQRARHLNSRESCAHPAGRAAHGHRQPCAKVRSRMGLGQRQRTPCRRRWLLVHLGSDLQQSCGRRADRADHAG